MSITSLPPSAGQCPVDHSKITEQTWNPHSQQHIQDNTISLSSTSSSSSSRSAPGCDSSSITVVGDIFPDASPSPDQRLPLSRVPVHSSIPRGGVDAVTGQAHNSTWVFPSPQRFYNAMKKKGWDAQEEQMAEIVSIHNTVNEYAWKQVLQYESLHKDICQQPRLTRFRGLPNQMSVKARVRSGLLGYQAPFDRHDWWVDRCGREVRYIIDFYQGAEEPATAANSQQPTKAASIHIDARPALDSTQAMWDRLRMAVKTWTG